MDYEKKYKEALELARDYYKANVHLGEKDENSMLEDIFPELKESEDEEIRKTLIAYMKSVIDINGIKGDTIIAWLEKQKYSDFDMENEYWRGYDDAKKHMEEKQLTEQKPVMWSEEDECYMGECISAIATKDGWSFEEKRKTKHWLESLKQRMEE